VNSRLHSFIINRARGLVSRSPKLEALIIQSVAIGAPAALKRVNPNNVFVSRKVTDVFAPEHWRERGVPTFLLSDLEFPNSILRRFDRTINSLVGLSDDEVSESVFFVYYECDSDALVPLARILECKGQFVPPADLKKTPYRFVNRAALNSLRKTWKLAERVSHLDPTIHENLCEALELTRSLEGDVVEIGTYKGGSALTMLNYLNEIECQKMVWIFDTFEGFDYEVAEKSSDVIWKGTHQLLGAEETMAFVSETLNSANTPYKMIRANICVDELPIEIRSISVANIDVDMYEATRDAFRKVAPLIVSGGIIISEDSTSTPGLYGAFVAMHEFLATEIGSRFTTLHKGSQYFLICR